MSFPEKHKEKPSIDHTSQTLMANISNSWAFFYLSMMEYVVAQLLACS